MNTKLILAATTLASTAGLAGLASSAHADKLEIGGQLQLLPLGSIEFEDESEDTAVAFGIAGTVDYRVHPNISVGLAPRLILGVQADGAEESATQLDLAARITGHVPVAPKVDLFAFASPGYSFTFPPEESDALGTPSGFALGFGGGAAFKVSPTLAITGELGYSLSFQGGTAEVLGTELDYDYGTNFLHLGVGVKAAI